MNILFICDEYPPGKNGGVGTAVQLLARELAKQGHKVFSAGLYAHSYGEKDYEEDQGVRVWRFRYGWNLHLHPGHIAHKVFNRIPGIIKQHLNGRKAFDAFTDFIRNLVETEKIDVIELPDWNTFAMRIGFLVKWPPFNVPLVVKSHGSYTYFAREMNKPAKRWLRDIDEELFRRADALSAVSLYTANKNREIFGITREIEILHNAINFPETLTKIKRRENRVVFTGTLMVKKGIFQLVQAWNKVNEKLPSAELIVFGKGSTQGLKGMLSGKASGTVQFKGHVKREELLAELEEATLAVFPSFSETFGLAVIEAMSRGCPVIFTKLSCGPEVVHDQVDGELVDPNNINEIAETIVKLLQDEGLRESYSKQGRETVRSRFNISVSARQHIHYYTHLIEEFRLNNNRIK